MNVTVYNELTGTIVRTVSGPRSVVSHNIRKGEKYIDGIFDGRVFRVEDGKPVENTKPDAPLGYREMRQAEYPVVKDQLDMLWHAMDTGAMPKAEPFYSAIKAIKDKYPKEASND